jgi:hypothetical protein
MHKRGNKAQVTLFVVLAIIIVAAVAIFVVTKTGVVKPAVSAEEAQKIVAAQAQPVKDKIESCMKTVALKALNTLGRQGGVLPIAKATQLSQPVDVMEIAPVMNYALFYDKERKDAGLSPYINYLPSTKEMGEGVDALMQNNPDFSNCINNFNEFKNDVDISFETNFSSNVDLGDKVVMNAAWPVKISKGEASTVVDNYHVTIPINFNKIYETSVSIINQIESTGEASVYVSEQAANQIAELRSNSDLDTITIESRAYEDIPSDSEGITYDVYNTLWILTYRTKALEKPFVFYFLTGEE